MNAKQVRSVLNVLRPASRVSLSYNDSDARDFVRVTNVTEKNLVGTDVRPGNTYGRRRIFNRNNINDIKIVRA